MHPSKHRARAVILLSAVFLMPTSAMPALGAAEAPAPLPRAECGPGSRPEPDLQGRAPADDPDRERGYSCNLELLSRFGDMGGYKVHRYVDTAGNECAYYDSTLLFPGSVANGPNGTGVHVLDMADPSKPVKTANLLTPAMESPHESVELNQKRGLIAADMGYPTFNPGFVDIYDVTQDCRAPVPLSSTPLGILGHESGFAPDGNTFYVSSTGGGTITALDVTDPTLPKILWVNRDDYSAHGMRLSAEGNRLYIADTGSGLIILDVSEIQARKPDPVVREVSRLEWDVMSIPQVAIPVTIKGQPYLVEVDEFSRGTSTEPDAPVGAARIIDISDETKPKIVSDIRLEVNNPAGREESLGDPGAGSRLQGYTGHYCSVPRAEEPGIVACSFIASGLRVFDIRDPLEPKEIAYWNQPVNESFLEPGQGPSTYAMSAPTFVPERGEIWYADGNSGFWALRFTNDVWPFPRSGGGSTDPDGNGGDGEGGGAGDEDDSRNDDDDGPTLPATGGQATLTLLGAVLLGAAVVGVGRRVT